MSIQIGQYHRGEPKKIGFPSKLAALAKDFAKHYRILKYWDKITGKQTEAACLARIATVYLPGTQPPPLSTRQKILKALSIGRPDPHTVGVVAAMSAIWIGFFMAFWKL